MACLSPSDRMKVFFAVFGSRVSSQASARRKSTQFRRNFTLDYSNQLLNLQEYFHKGGRAGWLMGVISCLPARVQKYTYNLGWQDCIN